MVRHCEIGSYNVPSHRYVIFQWRRAMVGKQAISAFRESQINLADYYDVRLTMKRRDLQLIT